MGPLYKIARTIATSVANTQLIVVAGRNTVLEQKLKAVAWEIPTQVHGFVSNMPELMGASDLLITKAGPGTISEAFIAGLPVIISSFIPGQEEDNVRYVLEHQAGVYAPDPEQIAVQVRELLRPGNEILQQMRGNAVALARPEAALNIAQRLQLLAQRPIHRPISSQVGRVRLALAKSSQRFRRRSYRR
jgi:1,2-diacylglycerol 3-beta-galactosyltransferase